jgi:hypothetical protein
MERKDSFAFYLQVGKTGSSLKMYVKLAKNYEVEAPRRRQQTN